MSDNEDRHWGLVNDLRGDVSRHQVTIASTPGHRHDDAVCRRCLGCGQDDLDWVTKADLCTDRETTFLQWHRQPVQISQRFNTGL
jgi:hypothetical protein